MLHLQFVGNKAKVRISKHVSRNKSTPNFPKNDHFLPPDRQTYVCVSGGKKWTFFGKLGAFCFLEKLVLRFALLPHYRRININENVTFLIRACKPPTSPDMKLVPSRPENVIFVKSKLSSPTHFWWHRKEVIDFCEVINFILQNFLTNMAGNQHEIVDKFKRYCCRFQMMGKSYEVSRYSFAYCFHKLIISFGSHF